MQTSLQIGHFDSLAAALSPWKIITEAAEQAHDLQKRWPQPKAYGLKTVSWEVTIISRSSTAIEMSIFLLDASESKILPSR